MRPTPAELIAGIRAILRESIAPELKGETTLRQFRRVMSVLREGRWNQAAFDILHENTAIVAMLQQCKARLPTAESIPEAARQWVDRLAPLLAPSPLPRTFEDANAMNVALRASLAQFLELAALQPTLASAPLRDRLVENFLALDADRGK